MDPAWLADVYSISVAFAGDTHLIRVNFMPGWPRGKGASPLFPHDR